LTGILSGIMLGKNEKPEIPEAPKAPTPEEPKASDLLPEPVKDVVDEVEDHIA
jgi:hypothetical protein